MTKSILFVTAFFWTIGLSSPLLAQAEGAFDPAHDLHGVDVRTQKPVEVSPGKKGEVVIFMSAKCPCSNSHVSAVKELAHDFGSDFQFAVVHANADESAAETQAYFTTAAFEFPVLQDDHARMANQLKAFKTPHAFVIANDGQILYHGGVTSSASASPKDKQYLREALSDLQKGQPVRVANGRTLGCAISR